MKRNRRPIGRLAAAALVVLMLPAAAVAQGDVTAETGFTKPRSSSAYGTTVMDKRAKDGSGVRPALFPHWAHRKKYACSACHASLGFPMKAGAADVTQKDIEAGKYCGACHNGKEAFGASECDKCHVQRKGAVAEDAAMRSNLKGLPKDDFGNKINWAEAARTGKIKPQASAADSKQLTALDLDVEMPMNPFSSRPPAVIFPHKAHTELLECSACHPSIFEQKKGGNPGVTMMKITAGQYCGACHGKAAFPLQDCFRCHSKPVPPPEKPKAPDDKEKKDKKDEKK